MILIYILAVLGGLGALAGIAFVVLELLADDAQRNGRNWFR